MKCNLLILPTCTGIPKIYNLICYSCLYWIRFIWHTKGCYSSLSQFCYCYKVAFTKEFRSWYQLLHRHL